MLRRRCLAAALRELCFEDHKIAIKPWTTSVVRSLRKEGKVYLCDWGEVG